MWVRSGHKNGNGSGARMPPVAGMLLVTIGRCSCCWAGEAGTAQLPWLAATPETYTKKTLQSTASAVPLSPAPPSAPGLPQSLQRHAVANTFPCFAPQPSWPCALFDPQAAHRDPGPEAA